MPWVFLVSENLHQLFQDCSAADREKIAHVSIDPEVAPLQDLVDAVLLGGGVANQPLPASSRTIF
jgi:hypothetical protein